eukprot:GHVP01021030.1.p1 GENE.GHVP01021030.1~~GHVP01021030.1.p1  ORF type:complete len:111 (-),score=1.92 GHVP01021030.1:164-496(-)
METYGLSAHDRHVGTNFINKVTDKLNTFDVSTCKRDLKHHWGGRNYFMMKDLAQPLIHLRPSKNDIMLMIDVDMHMTAIQKESTTYGHDAFMYTITPNKAAGFGLILPTS